MEKYARVFSHFDSNGDGKICAKELLQCMGSVWSDSVVTLEEVEKAVITMGRDGDGLLSLEDFVKIIEEDVSDEEMACDLMRAFEMYEESKGSGCITPRSLKRMLSRLGEHASVERCSSMIACFDLNGDGVLSFDEFKTMMMSY